MATSLRALPDAHSAARRAEANVRDVANLLYRVHHMQVADLAHVLGISRASAYERLNGRRAFGVGEVALMAEAWDVDTSVFYAGTDALLKAARSVTTLRKPEQQHPTTARAPRGTRPTGQLSLVVAA